jgi:hypothetical protein
VGKSEPPQAEIDPFLDMHMAIHDYNRGPGQRRAAVARPLGLQMAAPVGTTTAEQQRKEVIEMNLKTNLKAGLKSERVQDGNS